MPSVHGKASLSKIQHGIDSLESFDVASVHGSTWTGGTGRLEGDTLARYQSERDKIKFVVRHYATPVLWYLDGSGWVVNPDHYSPSTTATMGRLRVMIQHRGFYS